MLARLWRTVARSPLRTVIDEVCNEFRALVHIVEVRVGHHCGLKCGEMSYQTRPRPDRARLSTGYLHKGTDQFLHPALISRAETERPQVREVKLELSDQVVGAPQPQLLLLGVRPVGLGQISVLGGVVLLLQLQQGLYIGDISSVGPGGGQGAHGGLV